MPELRSTESKLPEEPDSPPADAGENGFSPHDTFPKRHFGSNPSEIGEMLNQVGLESLDELIDEAVPADIRLSELLDLPKGASESEALAELRKIASKNKIHRSSIGQGYYETLTPAVVQRNILETPGWYTQYTPYQAEISQGRLEALLNFQTLVTALTGLEIANASLLDEAIAMAHGIKGKGGRNLFFVANHCHAQTIEVVKTRAEPLGIEVQIRPFDQFEPTEVLFGTLIQYPATDGTIHEFDPFIRQVQEPGGFSIVHHNGGQVYMDGANMNAQVGLTNPAVIGADVCHLNLHKMFCDPYGGGGLIGVAEHRVPFLPSHPARAPRITDSPHTASGPVAAAPWGSAGILVVSWTYIRMMGVTSLTDATRIAILNANYMAERIAPHFLIVYRGANKRVAHEFIADFRRCKEQCGIEVEDIAKRLIDYGFHAPTMSWPVPGTMLIEPTESESKAELDRFCDALIEIGKEIAAIEHDELDPTDNPLQHAPPV